MTKKAKKQTGNIKNKPKSKNFPWKQNEENTRKVTRKINIKKNKINIKVKINK